ncbi:MAG: hypothetical protein CUN53_19010, partial [Phototrophicales bacterium]
EKTVAEACQEYDPTAQMVNDGKAQFLAAAPQAFEKGAPSSGEAERIAELERMVGKVTMQLEIAKKASRLLDGTSRRNGKRSSRCERRRIQWRRFVSS